MWLWIVTSGGEGVTCEYPGCEQKRHARGLCRGHYGRAVKAGEIITTPRPQGLLGGDYNDPIQAKSSTLSMFPRYPKRISDALYALAETPGLTLREYQERKKEIMNG